MLGLMQKGVYLSYTPQQLAILRRDGLVSTRRESQAIFYSLTQSNALRVIEVLKDIYCVRPTRKRKGTKA